LLDLFIFPLHRVDDPLQPELPGFLVVTPQKAGAHGREGDLLILYISPERPGVFTSLALKSMLQTAVDLYRKSHGTVTNGLRLMADHLNGVLLERNLRGPSANEPVLAMLNLVAIREDVLYIAQSGPTHSVFINTELVQDYSDTLTSGRGLGSTSALNLKYYQVEAKAGDVYIMASKPPEAWTLETLSGSNLLTLEHLRKRLLNQADPDLEAVVVKFRTGDGQVHVMRPRLAQPAAPAPPPETPAPLPLPVTPLPPSAAPSAAAATAPQAETPPAPPAAPLTAAEPPEPAQPPAAAPPQLTTPQIPPAITQATPAVPAEAETPVEPIPPPAQPAPEPVVPLPEIDTTKPLSRFDRIRLARAKTGISDIVPAAPTSEAVPHSLEATVQTAAPPPAAPAEVAPVPARRPKSQPRRPGVGRKRLAGIWLGWKSFWQKFGAAWSKFFTRLFPVKANQSPVLSPAAMLFTAIAVPLVVVAVAVTFYLQTGRSDQRNAYYTQALQFVAAAVQQTDITLQTNDWTQAINALDQADAISVTDDSRALRSRIQTGLDSIDGIVRLDFKPLLLFDLPTGTRITRMVASSSDIYLLDSSTGNILRLFLTGTGYALDKLFKCGPGANTQAPQVGALVDIAILPPNAQKATVLGMDANGVLMYCIPGENAISKALVPPDAGWNKPTSMAFSSDTLFVLDVPANAVWVYGGKDTLFDNAPALFFDKETPTLADVIDMAFYGDDLYLLRAGGEITLCTLSNVAFAPNRCKDPAPFGDPRPSHQPTPTQFSDATFTQILATQPPDPSLYMLDTTGQGVYHFSLLLNFQRQIRPSTTPTTDSHPPRQAPTAFTVSPTRQVVLAYGSQVYYGLLP
jgi:hypothetical protein